VSSEGYPLIADTKVGFVQLSPIYRSAVELHDVQGFSTEEIARKLAIFLSAYF
jgi:DNA-directed RNA polymerase specialized sigma24 family protein